ncbi:MAG: hypothetical protein AAF677_09915 [Pseudomonadota bacterium]
MAGDGLIGRLSAALQPPRRIEVLLFLVHDGPEAEDYGLVLDLPAFMALPNARPRDSAWLHVWAGRQDFARHRLAQRLRGCLATEFDAMTRAMEAELATAGSPGLVSRVLGAEADPMTKRRALAEAVAAKQRLVDRALDDVRVALHRELWAYAWRGQAPGPMTGMDRAAWPLPDHVRAALA